MNVTTLAPLALAAFLASASPDKSPPQPSQDCPVCPRMVALTGGTFAMGSPVSETERHKSEGPPRIVSVGAFAVSETEVTRGQYAAFVTGTKRKMPEGCDTHGDGVDTTSDHDPGASWLDPRFAQADDHPAV